MIYDFYWSVTDPMTRWYLATAEPEVIEPDQEPADDTEAELPDVREDPVTE